MHIKPIVYIIEDDESTRESLELLMRSEDLSCMSFNSAENFLEIYAQNMCGCLLLDISLSGMNGLELQSRMNKKHMPLPIVFMTGRGDITMAVQAIKNGALEFLEKPLNSEKLISTLKTALDLAIDRFKVKENQQRMADRLHNLTRREKQIFDLIAEGKMNKLIAYELNISIRTVEVHRAHIMEKLGARSVADIIHIAMNEVELAV